MRAIRVQYRYYRNSHDFENMISSANLLFHRATLFKEPTYQAIAKTSLFESYIFSGLRERGYRELMEGLDIINQSKENDSLTIKTKADVFISFTNYYSYDNDYNMQLKYLHLAGKEFSKLSNSDSKNKLLYIHNSNMGTIHNSMKNSDSASYYVTLSQSMNDHYDRTEVDFNNLFVLGEIAKRKKDYMSALKYFTKADTLEGYKNHFNLNHLYNNMIEIFDRLEMADSLKIYQHKKDSLSLNISQSQNRSLYKLLNERISTDNMKYLYIILIFGMGISLFFIIRKNNILKKQEKISQEYLKMSKKPTGEDYSYLIGMLKNNDLAFMAYFEKIFPDFTSKILQIYPEAIQSEIEFFALLKLKISTNDIAKYKNIEPKTVRNKKYTTRKQLKIPKGVDIYQWFNSL